MALPSPAEPIVREHAPAKLNLDLLITARRADGYHELDSLVAFTDIGDELTFQHADTLSLELTGPFAAVLPAGSDNLVLRAAHGLAAAAGRPALARIRLEKRLPVAAGIGGGSADAAATLRGLQRLWGTALGTAELAALALSLGADVPVCVLGRAVRMRGIGELLQPVAELPALQLVLVNPGLPLATAAVFKALRAETFGNRPAAVPGTPSLAWLRTCRNDLETPARALLPVVGEILTVLAAEPDCRFARMSGSGPTCFGAFATRAAAEAASRRIAARYPRWWVAACRTLDPATSEVATRIGAS
jgi:4-diphosphocytidyl-2-C-methyl-D-erythritol kinase